MADNSLSGVNLGVFSIRRGITTDLGFIGALSANSPTFMLSYTTFLVAGQSFGAYVDMRAATAIVRRVCA